MDKQDILVRICLYLIICLFVYFLILYVTKVPIGEKIAKESYENEEEWLWNLGIFVGTMSAISYLIDTTFKLLEQWKKKKLKNSKRK